MSDLISRQAAIDAIRDMQAFEDDNGQPYLYLYDLMAVFTDEEELPTIHPEPHWIPVTEDTLPEENRVVVVCGNKGTWDYGTYRGHGDNIHFWHWKKNTYKRVYWWMYKEDALPEPYKGVTT